MRFRECLGRPSSIGERPFITSPASAVTRTTHLGSETVTHEHPTEPVYPFGPPGPEVLLHRGAMAVGDVHGTGRVWMHRAGSLDHRWELDPDAFSSVQLGDARLTFLHAALGPVDLPVRVTSSAGRGIVLPTTVVGASALHEVVVHWVNVPSIYPADALASDWGTWAGRWSGSGGGWSQRVRAGRTGDARLARNPAEQPASGSPGSRPLRWRIAGSARGCGPRWRPDRAEHRDGQRDLGRLGALADHPEQLVAAGVTQVLKLSVAGFPDP